MILNNVDNLMYGAAEVDRAYNAGQIVWERRRIPTGYMAIPELWIDESTYGADTGFNTHYKPINESISFAAELKVVKWKDATRNGSILLGNWLANPFKDLEVDPPIYYYRNMFNIFVNSSGGNGWVELESKVESARKKNSLKSDLKLDYTDFHTVSGEISSHHMSAAVDNIGVSNTFEYENPIWERDIWVCTNGDANNHVSTSGDNKRYGNFIFKWLKIYDGGQPARDFVPARRLSDGANGFWDYCTDQFYLPFTVTS